jgi:hypothetical protein
MSKHQNESGYQDMFKKELEKAGKGIGSMTPAEKKAFFNKIDDKYKAKNEDIKEGRYEVTGTVTYQGISGEDEVTVVVDAMDKMDAEDVADDMIDDLRRAKKIGPKRGGQVKRFDPFDVEYTRKKEGLVDKMMEKVDEPYAVGMAQAMKSTGDKAPLKKSTITKAHDIAKSIMKKEEMKEARWEIEGRVSYKGISSEDSFYMVIDAPSKDAAERKAYKELDNARQRKKIGPGGGGSIDDADIESIERTNDRLSPPETGAMMNSYDPTQKEQADKPCPKCGKDHANKINASNCMGESKKTFSDLRTETKVIKLGDKGKTATGKEAGAVDVEPRAIPV